MTLNSLRILGALIITLIFLNCVNCQASYVPNAVHPDYPNKCYYEGPPVTTLNIGETRRVSKECILLKCGKGFLLKTIGCGLHANDGQCYLLEDLSKPYPDCCPEFVC